MPTRIILLINILVNKYLFYMPECQLLAVYLYAIFALFSHVVLFFIL